MQQHRVLVAFAAAWLTALLLSWAVYKKTTAPQSRQTVQVVAAAKDLPAGARIATSDIKLLTIDRKDLPKGAMFKTADVVDRAVLAPMVPNELVLNGKLAAPGGGEGMTALIEPGLRAVSVQVNEISSVSGFIQPGTHVDVLFTRQFSNGDAATTTLLQDLKVIAYGKQLAPQSKTGPEDTARTNAVTLLVTEEQAEKLALAMQRGHIQLVLRNPLDNQILDDGEPVDAADLGIDEPQKKEPPRPVIVPPPAPKAKPPGAAPVEQYVESGDQEKVVVHVYRGSKVSQDVFEK